MVPVALMIDHSLSIDRSGPVRGLPRSRCRPYTQPTSNARRYTARNPEPVSLEKVANRADVDVSATLIAC